jgi:ribose transport system ATP-binding protein
MEKKVLFSAKDISKSFHGTQALKGVDLEVREGEVVGLIGENGAGKSTLLKIIIGVQPPSSGEMTMHGKPYAPKTPMDANKQGIGMVFQEQSLITNLTVGQNIFFGYEKEFRNVLYINWRKMYEAAKKALDNVGAEGISPRKKVLDYNFATRQMIEIAKVVNVSLKSGNEHCLILLDEPTSLLNEDEVQGLFTEIKKLTALGHSVIFVSHRLDEVLEITDKIYVYKDGMNVGEVETKNADERKLYEMMVGRSTTTEYYKIDQQREPEDEVVLECEDLGLKGVFKHVSFKLHKGEILGIAGVVGSGKEAICSVLCGDDVATSGKYYLKGKPVRFKSPSEALKHKVLMVPKERLVEGIVSTLSVAENICMSQIKKPTAGPLISNKKVKQQTGQWIDKLRIKTSGCEELLIQLSGGNQQKVVFSRALASECDVLILNHPTRGVDVGAKEDIYSLIREMVNQGKSVILLGDTLDECISMSNRVLVMKDGLITGELDSPSNNKLKQVDIVTFMM